MPPPSLKSFLNQYFFPCFELCVFYLVFSLKLTLLFLFVLIKACISYLINILILKLRTASLHTFNLLFILIFFLLQLINCFLQQLSRYFLLKTVAVEASLSRKRNQPMLLQWTFQTIIEIYNKRELIINLILLKILIISSKIYLITSHYFLMTLIIPEMVFLQTGHSFFFSLK